MPISRRTFLAASAASIGIAQRELLGMPAARAAPVPTTQAPPGLAPWLEIDAAALEHNVGAARRLAGGRPVIAVVKNNAYGLGLASAGPLFDRMAGVSMLAAVRANEALALRRAGCRRPILLMGPASEEELVELVRLDVVQSPYRDAAPSLLARVARRAGRPVHVHLYVDTGMHRMGIPVERALLWAQQLANAGDIRIDGAFTELTEDADFDRGQATRLLQLRSAARDKGIAMDTLHAASSDAIMHGNADTFLDAVRPGLALYGGYVSDAARQRGALRPAYRLKTRVIRVDHLAEGEGVSYHRRWIANRPTWTATLAVGHVDGYPSGSVRGGEVLARGRLFPVIGTVSASHTIISLGDERAVDVGDEVTLIGPDSPALHPNEVAKRAGWSEYNMFMHLSPDLPRVVIGAASPAAPDDTHG